MPLQSHKDTTTQLQIIRHAHPPLPTHPNSTTSNEANQSTKTTKPSPPNTHLCSNGNGADTVRKRQGMMRACTPVHNRIMTQLFSLCQMPFPLAVGLDYVVRQPQGYRPPTQFMEITRPFNCPVSMKAINMARLRHEHLCILNQQSCASQSTSLCRPRQITGLTMDRTQPQRMLKPQQNHHLQQGQQSLPHCLEVRCTSCFTVFIPNRAPKATINGADINSP